jgi:hypothetical protein
MSETDGEDWETLAERLHDRGGIPEGRADVIALLATGRSHSEAADALGYSSTGSISNHVERYREEDLAEAEWLLEHGPEI